jgi:hypothetical protein
MALGDEIVERWQNVIASEVEPSVAISRHGVDSEIATSLRSSQ